MAEYGGETLTLFEILQPLCTRRFGDGFFSPTGGCQAQIGSTGTRKCMNTFATCQDSVNYNPDILVIRFAKQQAGLLQYGGAAAGSPAENTTNVIASLLTLDTTPAMVNLAGMDRSAAALGQREVVTVTLEDHKHSDLHVDPYRLERPAGFGSPPEGGYDPYEQGTFWTKWLARNPYHANYLCRVREGYVGDALDDMRVRTYTIDRVEGPSDGMVKVIAKDLFSRIEARKSVAPIASRGELRFGITANESPQTATLSPTGIGDLDYPFIAGSPSELYVSIGDEVIRCSRSGDVLSLIQRGALSTVADDHAAEDLVQWVLVYTSQQAHDIVYDLLVNYTSIDASLIDLADWDVQAEQLTQLYTARIAKPTSVSELIGELAEQAGFTVWPDPVTQMVRFKTLRASAASVTVDEDGWILADSYSSKLQISKRASQVWVYYGQRSPAENLDERRNFASRLVIADVGAEETTQYGVPVIREIFSRWIPQFGRDFAEDTGDRILAMFRDPPLEIEFTITTGRDGELGLAEYFDLEVTEITDDTGAMLPTLFAATQLARGENDIRVKAQQVRFVTGDGETERVIYIENDSFNLNLRSVHDSLYSVPTTQSPSLVVRFIVLAGVIVGSTSTSSASVRTGSWPAGVDVYLENRGRIQGKGGAGGASAFPSGSPGLIGGDALLVESLFRIDNEDGQIWAGGGGGGGSEIFDLEGGDPPAGGGGGGGAGTDGGLGGAGATSDQNGASGTSEVGGVAGGSYPFIGGNGGDPGLAGAAAPFGGAGGAAGKYLNGIANVIWTTSPQGDLRGSVS